MSPDRTSGYALIGIRSLFSLSLAAVLLAVGVPAIEAEGSRVRAAAAFLASPLLAYAVVHLVVAAMGLTARRLPKVAGVVVLESAERTSVRFDYALPLVAGWYIAFLTSVAMAVVFTGLIAAGLTTIGIAALWIAIVVPIGAGAAIWLLTSRRVRSGARDLVIDRAASVLHLPRRAGRPAEALAFGDIHAIGIGPPIDPSEQGCIECEDLAVVIFTDQWKSPAQARRLGNWSDRTPAEEFAAWLRERLQLSGHSPK